MAGQYSHKHFFRHVPNHQLAEYFSTKAVELSVDFDSLKEKEIDAIFIAFAALPEEQQATIEAEFQDVHAMACEGGITALIDEAHFYSDESFVENISDIEGFHSKVMWAYLNKHDYWLGATMFLHADNVSHSYWKRRNDLPHVAPNVDESTIKALASAISKFFHTNEGRGRNCQVEVYRRHDKKYFFAFPEDFGLSSVEWVSDSLKTRARHPAFEIIFVYCESEGSLDIYAPKNTKAVPELQKFFAKTILNIETLANGKIDKKVYDLDPIGNAEFKFTIEPESGIDEVLVTQLRLTLKHGSKRRITLEADTKNNSQAVYDLLADLNPPTYYVTQTRIKVIFEPKIGERTKTKTFNITHPNSCALGHEGNDLKIRQMLVKSGIEPQL